MSDRPEDLIRRGAQRMSEATPIEDLIPSDLARRAGADVPDRETIDLHQPTRRRQRWALALAAAGVAILVSAQLLFLSGEPDQELKVALSSPSASEPTTNSKTTINSEYPWDYEHDFQNDLVYFWNVTKEAYCHWAEIGFPGGGPAGVEPVEVTTIEFPDASFIWTYEAKAPIEIWTNTHSGETCDPDDELFARGSATQNQRNVTNETQGSFQSNRQGQGVVVEEGTTNRYTYSWTSIGTNTGAIQQEFDLKPIDG